MDGAAVAEYCERLVGETGVLLLPSSLYDGFENEPRFRLGFGRKNMAENLEVAVGDEFVCARPVLIP